MDPQRSFPRYINDDNLSRLEPPTKFPAVEKKFVFYLPLSVKIYFGAALFGLLVMFFLVVLLNKNISDRASSYLTLEIIDTASKRNYLRLPINENFEFAIEFIHSVNNSPVREYFAIEEKIIKPVSVRFYSFGAGMLSQLEDGQKMERDEDALIITGFNRSYAELNYIVGTVSDHLLIIDGKQYSLTDLCGKNAHVTFRVRKYKEIK